MTEFNDNPYAWPLFGERGTLKHATFSDCLASARYRRDAARNERETTLAIVGHQHAAFEEAIGLLGTPSERVADRVSEDALLAILGLLDLPRIDSPPRGPQPVG